MSDPPQCSARDSPIIYFEDEDEKSSNATTSQEVEDVLQSFREKWQNELKISKPIAENDNKHTNSNSNPDGDCEQQAKNWFRKGSENERSGKLYEAIQCYKRAVQLVPDIEFKISQKPNTYIQLELESDNDTDIEDNYLERYEEHSEDDEDEDEPIKDGLLLARIQRKMNKAQLLCVPEYEQRTMHVASLPMEILLYILKWVVSNDLDLRSLEMCSMVCRGFYLCARDQEIWRLACIRAWGVNCGSSLNVYSSWRDMYLKRVRLHFNGCYISKTTYIRHGENSFQDQFYRPWHIVAYYRYLRFFPDGQVLMLTTADEPSQCVGLLKNRMVKRPSMLMGHYRLKEDGVSIVLQQTELIKNTYNQYKKRGRAKNAIAYESSEQTFHLELQIQSYHKRKNVQLIWTGYSVFTRSKGGAERQTTFDLVNTKYPPFWFSRVKSYTVESNSPLQ